LQVLDRVGESGWKGVEIYTEEGVASIKRGFLAGERVKENERVKDQKKKKEYLN
jgi:hypothetical protein